MADYRIIIAREVLECAEDAEDEFVITLCRKAITASLLGWKKYGNDREFNIIRDFWHDSH